MVPSRTHIHHQATGVTTAIVKAADGSDMTGPAGAIFNQAQIPGAVYLPQALPVHAEEEATAAQTLQIKPPQTNRKVAS